MEILSNKDRFQACVMRLGESPRFFQFNRKSSCVISTVGVTKRLLDRVGGKGGVR